MKKKWIILGICLIIVIFVCGIIFYMESYKEVIEYKVMIKTNDNSDYILYIPLCDSIDNIDDFYRIEGNGEYDIIRSEYGKCLKIRSNSNISFFYRDEHGNFGDKVSLTMINEMRSYWIYYENSSQQSMNINVNIQLKRDFKNEITLTEIESDLLIGWNIYNATISKQ